ncbi:MarR family winged helix-turn-helix transcriptional regulator [Streptomyces zagrosensis]|uniref:DNA-binding MarR family transcriptional regulator n=1 Tax=Streptomyces zagrosensis TaxID=1042984 RepID=A0A7W9QD12_9ACTN|nr:MarR family transcriptional regulator [Streptomyces zagrosensis]MBB5936942.1 DNA-binding MarR family transcriptional regulator [Streptomyces zagrosensis]
MHNTGVGTPGEGEGRAGIDSAFLALERELSVFLRRARANSGEMAREVHPDLEPAAYGLLARLNDVGQVRATDLASYFGVGKATMSRQLRALETLGLIARAPDPDDGRAWLVQLTEEGRTRFTRVRGGLRARYAQRLEGWNRAEVAELARLLHRLNSGHEPDTAPESLPGQDTSPEPAVSDQQPEPIPPEPTV